MKKENTFFNLPQEIRNYTQWVLWRLEPNPKKPKKPNKIPYQVNGSKAKSNDPGTFSTFDKAMASYQTGNYTGIGFVFTKDDDFCGIDFDHCIDQV